MEMTEKIRVFPTPSPASLRFLLVVATRLLSGLLGAVVGCAQALAWPLSRDNMAYAVQWGLGAGLLGSVLLNALALTVHRSPGPEAFALLVGNALTALTSGLTLFVYASMLAAC